MKFENKHFVREKVQLDGNEYLGCTFESCMLVYSASAGFRLGNNAISEDCRFFFSGAAGDTVETLRAIYGMGDWGRAQVLAMFQQIAPDMPKLN